MSTWRGFIGPPESVCTSIPIDEEGSDDDDPYDVMTRMSMQPERVPLENYMLSISFELCLHAASLENYMVMMIMHVI